MVNNMRYLAEKTKRWKPEEQYMAKRLRYGEKQNHNFFFQRKNEEQVYGNNEIKRQKASTSEPVNEANIEPVNEANNEPVNEANNEPVNEANNEPNNEPVNEANQNIPQNPININEVDVSSLERDPAKRLEMWKYPVNIREQVRLAYMSLGVYQIKLEWYKPRGPKNNLRRFRYAWFDMFPNI
ncbi:uncharacterized protein LOC110944506 [Helianthus annuus]|uniref:uncharacterized protein LOC110944506 n=1 Tax=Helianthus annuus TaxID=4232 RepID=UPI000B90A100|nr:uncharacterized protein LOC110944506 [Helianthus annuus]